MNQNMWGDFEICINAPLRLRALTVNFLIFTYQDLFMWHFFLLFILSFALADKVKIFKLLELISEWQALIFYGLFDRTS